MSGRLLAELHRACLQMLPLCTIETPPNPSKPLQTPPNPPKPTPTSKNSIQPTPARQVGISSVWYEGNPCNMHLMDLALEVKKGVEAQGLVGYRCARLASTPARSLARGSPPARRAGCAGGSLRRRHLPPLPANCFRPRPRPRPTLKENKLVPFNPTLQTRPKPRPKPPPPAPKKQPAASTPSACRTASPWAPTACPSRSSRATSSPTRSRRSCPRSGAPPPPRGGFGGLGGGQGGFRVFRVFWGVWGLRIGL